MNEDNWVLRVNSVIGETRREERRTAYVALLLSTSACLPGPPTAFVRGRGTYHGEYCFYLWPTIVRTTFDSDCKVCKSEVKRVTSNSLPKM